MAKLAIITVLAAPFGFKRSAGAYFAAHADFQKRHQSFVLMPMALLGEPWVECWRFMALQTVGGRMRIFRNATSPLS